MAKRKVRKPTTTTTKMAGGKKTKMAMKGGKKTKMAMMGGKKTKMAMKGGKKTKMAAKSTTARGSGAARPQKFRKNG
jgi:hypothetical protein